MSRKPTIVAGKPIRQGRTPTPFLDEYCHLLTEHMGNGYSFESFGAHVYHPDGTKGVGRDVLYGWIEKFPQFAEAKDRGEILARQWWEDKGHEGMCGLIPGFQQATYIFMMKNKFGFRDKVELDASMTTHNITTNVNIDIEVNARVEELSMELRKLLDVSREAKEIKDITPQRIKLKSAD